MSALATAVGIASTGAEWAVKLSTSIFDNDLDLSITEFMSAIEDVPMPIEILQRIVPRLNQSNPYVTRSFIQHSSVTPKSIGRIKGAGWLNAGIRHQVSWGDETPTKIVTPSGEPIANVSFSSISLPSFSLAESVPSPGKAWMAEIAATKFSSNPSKERLAEALRCFAIYGRPVFEWRSSWVISMCLIHGQDPQSLLDLAIAAESGALGDTTTWLAAEARWRKSIKFTELYSKPINNCPIPPDIGLCGFPIRALVSIAGSSQSLSKAAADEITQFIFDHSGSSESGELANLLAMSTEDPVVMNRFSEEARIKLLEEMVKGLWSVNVGLLRWILGLASTNLNRFLAVAENMGSGTWMYARPPIPMCDRVTV